MIGIESASMNVPIIATNVPGFREQIQLGKFGVLYEPTGKAEDDAEIIESIILEYWNLWPKIGENGRSFVKKFHASEQQLKKYQEFFAQYLDGKKSHDSPQEISSARQAQERTVTTL